MATTEYRVYDSMWGISFSTKKADVAEEESRGGARVTASTRSEK